MRLRKLIKTYRPNIVALAEPFLMEKNIPDYLGRFSCESFVTNEVKEGKIWLMWNSAVTVHWLESSNQHVSVRVEENGHVFLLTIVYAKCNYMERKALWADLEAIHSGSLPWILCGDFNIIRNDSDRRGGRPRPFAAVEDFNFCIQNCGLLDMSFKGPKMTWCNGQGGLARSWARLDRCLINPNVLHYFPNIFFQVLSRITSDHSPLVVQMGIDPFRYGPSPFRFQFMWTDHIDFFPFVDGVWKQKGLGSGLINLAFKLKRMKVAFKDWNHRVFGKTNTIIKDLEQRIDCLESRLQVGFNEEDDTDLLASKLELLTWMGREDTRLAHMAKKSWLKDGDQNSKFYHAYLNTKSHKRIKEMCLSDGTILNSPYDIHQAAVPYFQNFLGHTRHRVLPNLNELIDHVITDEDNLAICRAPSLEEVKDALFSIPIDSSPGPDGFGSGFFRVCWDIVKEDILDATVDFFENHSLPRFYTASYIVLLPKVDKPSSFDKFRPISLCSVIYKICTKIIVGRFTFLLSKMISQEQGAFIPGRSIFENISLTQEMVYSIHKRSSGGNVMVKLDMSKAYDRVDWNFLLHVLANFGFSTQVIDMIQACISSPWYSIMMNGTSLGFFKGERGLRQGDPLSPYLFIIMQEVLSRLLKQYFSTGKIGSFSQARGTPIISHLMYADDVIIFANGSKNSMRNLMKVLTLYEDWTGQVLNKDKSAIYFSKKIPTARRHAILNITGFSEGSFPFKYLGVPIVVGRLKASYFGDLLGKVQKKIAGWKMKMLSAGGRTILLRHVLASMATHLLAVLHVPKIVLGALNKLLSSFFWGDSDGKAKRKWIPWNHICNPTDEGGLGIRNFGDIQKALHMKLAWRLMQGQSLWADFFKGKYIKNSHLSLLEPNKGTRIWKSIVRCIPEVLNGSKWKVREGNISFWYDNWEEHGPLSSQFSVIEQPHLKIKDCRIDNGWDIHLLDSLVGHQKASELCHFLAGRREGQDVLIWLKDTSGFFSTKSAWDCVRVKASPLPWAHWIWHTHLPKKISIMMWKAFNNCLSVDDRIKRVGISMASKCNCCSAGHTEDLNHVLCTGNFARQIWRMAAVQLGVNMDIYQTWQEQSNFWFRRAGKSSQVRVIFGLLPSIVSWKLWKRRCKARYEDRIDSVEAVWHAIRLWIRRIMDLIMKVTRLPDKDVAILQRLDIPILSPRLKKVRVVRWTRPPQGWVKLNTDGSSLGNPGPSGAGGVIRDDRGRLLDAYSVFLNQGSNNYAELRSLLEGVRRCYYSGFFRVEIEIDSQLLVTWLNKGACNNWYLEDFWEELLDYLNCMDYKVNHVFREGNVVADYLAKRGAGGLNSDWSGELPSRLRGLIHMDRLGLPYLRTY